MSAVARTRIAAGTYESRRGAQTLIEQAMSAVRALAALDGPSPSVMLEVLDELREIVHAEIDADLVEVSPGAFLPSAEAALLNGGK